MPLACTAVSAGASAQPLFYDRLGLLRHFAECLLHRALVGVSFPAAFKKTIKDSLLDLCLAGVQSLPASSRMLERYRQWQTWREAVATRYSDDCQLGFQLLEGARRKRALADSAARRFQTGPFLEAAAG